MSGECGWHGCPGPDSDHEVVMVYLSNSGETWGVTVNRHWRGGNGWVGTFGKGYAYYNADLSKAISYAERRVAGIESHGRVAVLQLDRAALRSRGGER